MRPLLRELREPSELAAVEDERLPAAMDNDGMELEQHNDVIARLQLLADSTVILSDSLDEHHRTPIGDLEGNAGETLLGRAGKLAAQCAVVLGKHGDAEMLGSAQIGPRG